jgi:hypothetical protein
MSEWGQDRVRGQNGMPEFRPYVYRGTGADTLTPDPGRCPETGHTLYWAYRQGCRCGSCRAAHSARGKAYWAARGAR